MLAMGGRAPRRLVLPAKAVLAACMSVGALVGAAKADASPFTFTPSSPCEAGSCTVTVSFDTATISSPETVFVKWHTGALPDASPPDASQVCDPAPASCTFTSPVYATTGLFYVQGTVRHPDSSDTEMYPLTVVPASAPAPAPVEPAPGGSTAPETPPAADASPVATCDVYWQRLGTRLTVPAPGFLANDSDPQGLPLTATIDHINFAPADHPYNVNATTGAFTLSAVSRPFVALVTYHLTDSAGSVSAPTTITIYIQEKPPTAAQLGVCGPAGDHSGMHARVHYSKGWGWDPQPTCRTFQSGERAVLLRGSIWGLGFDHINRITTSTDTYYRHKPAIGAAKWVKVTPAPPPLTEVDIQGDHAPDWPLSPLGLEQVYRAGRKYKFVIHATWARSGFRRDRHDTFTYYCPN